MADARRGRAGSLQVMLLLSVFVIATCGLIYELVAGTLASYLLGDSVTQFSTIIGVYLFSMGIGSWLSGYIEQNLLRRFIQVELLVGLVGGCSAPLLYVLFEQVSSFRVVLYGVVGLTGVLVGLEIPLLMRILKREYAFKDLVSRVFTFDYIGALLASLVFPLLLVPYLGLLRTSLFFGLLNTFVAGWLLFRFQDTLLFRRQLYAPLVITTALLLAGFVFAEKITAFSESMAYQDRVLLSKSTPYQRIVLTKNPRELRLYLNGNLQFSSADEYRYHEALVHPAAQGLRRLEKVLVLGGGDGLAVRELLRYPGIQSILLVDLDKGMTDLFRQNKVLLELNRSSLLQPKVNLRNLDAFRFVRTDTAQYDLIIVDFPDPSNYSIGKLYTQTFYTELYRLLRQDGAVVVQSTSPYVARRSYWCVGHTLAAAGFQTLPYHCYVPSFGEWGYVLALKNRSWNPAGQLPRGLRYVSPQSMREMFLFPPDMSEVPTDTNRLNNQVLVHYFEQDWGPYQQ